MDCWAIQGIVASLTMAGGLPSLLAYVDPGTGSLIFQMVVAGLLTTTWMLRRILFGRKVGDLKEGRGLPPRERSS
jgi:hypothetical protein